MNATQNCILIYGHDARLLDVRKWALQYRGYHVVTVEHLNAIDRIPQGSKPVLVVLCHTLSPRECLNAVKRASVYWPEIKAITLVRDGAKSAPEVSGRIPHTIVGATRLLAMVTELAGTAGSSPYSHTY
jgi:hypothetical protein